MVLFANYKTLSVAVDKDGKKHKAQGSRRVLYTSHHACWDAKNRHGLPEELPLDYAQIAHCIPDLEAEVKSETTAPAPTPAPKPEPAIEPESTPLVTEQPKDPEVPAEQPEGETGAVDEHEQALDQLYDLIDRSSYDRSMVQWAVTSKGYYPVGTPIETYDTGFIKGVLIAAWDQVDAMIKEQLEKNIPF